MKYLTKFIPTIEKVSDLSKKLVSKKFYLSEENRTEEFSVVMVNLYFNGYRECEFFEIGEWSGLLGFVDIIRGWKADLFFKIWDKDIWNHSLVREIDCLIESTMKEFGIKRLSLQTPDSYMVKLAKRHGFKQEGILKNSYKWDDKFYDIICLARED